MNPLSEIDNTHEKKSNYQHITDGYGHYNNSTGR